MQLTQYTDYALRTLVFLALKKEKTSTISEIARFYSISKSHLMKIINQLGQLQVVETLRGKGGGIRLNTVPNQLNLGDLIEKLEPHFHLVECFNPAKNSCIISPGCRLKLFLNEAGQSFINTLKKYTLQDVIQNNTPLLEIFSASNNQ